MIALIRDFSDFSERNPFKENPITCHEHDFSHLSPSRKVFQVFYTSIDFSIWGVTLSLAVFRLVT